MGELCIWGPWWAFCNIGWYGYDCSLKLVAYTFLLKPRHIACVLIHCSGEVYCFLPHWVVPEITSLLLHLSLSLCTPRVPSYSFSCLRHGVASGYFRTALAVFVADHRSSCTSCLRCHFARKVTYLWGFGDDVKTRLPISWVCDCRKDAGCV